jgi:hypothetical protein
MQVAVQVHGALRGAAGAARNLDLSLPDRATAGDLLALLRDRLGPAFAAAPTSADPRLPREVRLFVGGNLVVSRDQPLATQGSAAPVTVVLLSPVAGG